ncbi:MAG: glucose-6-phosphate dehydrogenase [Anaerolineae bacterium]
MKANIDPAVIVIFGASGDLTQRKLVPALHSLACSGLLHPDTHVLGVARSPLSDLQFREHLFEGVEEYSRLDQRVCNQWQTQELNYSYLQGSYDDPQTYRDLQTRLAEIRETARGNVLYYLAVPPSLYPVIVNQLGAAGLNHSAGWVRIIIEKPFGRDLASARELNDLIHQVFDEQQVYRIDHYLGKETVQNLLSFRFGNAIFEPLWNRNYIDHVQITVAEDIGVEHRAGYYEQAGVLRDMFQNHLLQLLTLTALEPPNALNAKDMRDEKVKVLQAVRGDIRSVRAQYEGYRSEPGVAPDSQTATFGALRLQLDNWRWQGVPFFLRSGKMLATKTSEISVHFNRVPHQLFTFAAGEEMPANVLSFVIQPEEGIHLRVQAKEPGWGMRARTIELLFKYNTEVEGLPDAYERLLLDAVQGDATLFTRADEIELAWGIIDPVAALWQSKEAPPLLYYKPGTWGPREAEALLEGRVWMSANSPEFGAQHQVTSIVGKELV